MYGTVHVLISKMQYYNPPVPCKHANTQGLIISHTHMINHSPTVQHLFVNLSHEKLSRELKL